MLETTGMLLAVLLDVSLRILFAAAGVALVLFFFRVRSNPWRHVLWTSVVCTMLLMPALRAWAPSLTLPVARATPQIEAVVSYIPDAYTVRSATATPRAIGDEKQPANRVVSHPARRFDLPWQMAVAAIYLLGVFYFGLRLLSGWYITEKLRRDAHRVDLPGPSPAYESTLVATPVTAGVFRPWIMLPAGWTSWQQEKLHAILSHERTHIARRDPLMNFIANLNCVFYWFHPLAWWLRKRLAITSEFACDDAAVAATGRPDQYAQILVQIAGTLRERGRRLSWHAMGVQGRGSLSARIDRILRRGQPARISTKRKALTCLSAAALILVAVACRDQSISLPDLSDLKVEEERAAEREAAQAARVLKESNRFVAQQKLEESVRAMTRDQVAALESDVNRDPENSEARERLLYFYARGFKDPRPEYPTDVLNRRRHILWLIEHHPDNGILGMWVSRLSPLPSGLLPDAEGYSEAKNLWLTQTRAAATPPVVLLNAAHLEAVFINAAYFLEVADKPLAERLLLQGKPLQPGVNWSVRLGRLYALALLGAVDAETYSANDDTFPRGFVILGTSESEANSAFVQSVRKTLARSKDVHMLNAVAQDLMLRFGNGVKMATTYFQRAVDVDPYFVPAHQGLLNLTSRKKQSETQAVLMKLPVESRFSAVLALPESQRFPALREMAERTYQESNSLAVLDRDQAQTKRNLSRRYAEALLKLTPRFRSDPGYSSALFSGNILAGFVAARDGDTDTALKYLHAASTIPSSEEMAFRPPFVPYQSLGVILAGTGHRTDVIAFYEHFAQINLSERDHLLQLAMELRMP